jgi:hypothetical protein
MLHILTLSQINDLQLACFMYCCIHNLLPRNFTEMFYKNESLHSYHTRQKDHLHIVGHTLNIRKHTVRISGPVLWNNLSSDLRIVSTVHVFNRRYKQMLFNTP